MPASFICYFYSLSSWNIPDYLTSDIIVPIIYPCTRYVGYKGQKMRPRSQQLTMLKQFINFFHKALTAVSLPKDCLLAHLCDFYDSLGMSHSSSAKCKKKKPKPTNNKTPMLLQVQDVKQHQKLTNQPSPTTSPTPKAGTMLKIPQGRLAD